TNKLIMASIFLIAFHLVLIVSGSCGILTRHKVKSNSDEITKLKIEEGLVENTRLQFLEWHKVWMQESEFSTTYIQSDSAIVYQPGSGFSLTKGAILLTNVKQNESIYEDSIMGSQERSNELMQNMDYLKDDQYDNKSVETERQSFGRMNQIVIIGLAIIVLWVLYRIQ